MSVEAIYNYRRVDDQTLTAGQPTPDQLRDAAAEGVRTVINLNTYRPGDPMENEAALVEGLGMQYHAIPVDWGNPLDSDFAAFERVLQSLPPGKTLIHCAANYRVTAFFALYALRHPGWTPEQADAFRGSVWEGDYPAWEALWRRLKA